MPSQFSRGDGQPHVSSCRDCLPSPSGREDGQVVYPALETANLVYPSQETACQVNPSVEAANQCIQPLRQPLKSIQPWRRPINCIQPQRLPAKSTPPWRQSVTCMQPQRRPIKCLQPWRQPTSCIQSLRCLPSQFGSDGPLSVSRTGDDLLGGGGAGTCCALLRAQNFNALNDTVRQDFCHFCFLCQATAGPNRHAQNRFELCPIHVELLEIVF